MLNVNTLDTVIALVVVILLLSLIVQSVQGFIKKLLKLKSREIEDSLLDLFNAVLRDKSKSPHDPNRTSNRSKTRLPRIFAASPEPASSTATELLEAVKREMQELGRVNARGHFMADSLSKGDLLNILARVAPGAIGGDFRKLIAAIQQLEATIAGVQAQTLPAEVSVLWAKFQGALAPLRQHYKALTDGTGSVAPGVIVADVLALRDVVFDDSLELLAKVQAAGKNVPGLDQTIATLSSEIVAARDALDQSFGAFRTKLTETEQWFDTTMQSFEERYHRGMRTVSIVVSAVVVILLNADVFTLYRNIAASEVLRADLVAAGPGLAQLQQDIATREAALEEAERKAAEEKKAKEEKEKEARNASASSTDMAAASSAAATDTASAAAAPAAAAGKPAPKSTREQLEEEKEQLERLVRMYTDFGLEPVTWKGITDWFEGLIYRDAGEGTWGSRRLGDLRTLFGWFLMTLLLSLGAPFWHDALESLFGVKNLLRRRNAQQNVEQARGAGNPKV